MSTPPRRVNARRILAASAIALGASGPIAWAQSAPAPLVSQEDGEAGEGGVVIDPGADLGLYLAQIDILEAQTALLEALIAGSNAEDAAQLLAAMRASFKAGLEEKVSHHAEDFNGAFDELETALANGTDPLNATDWLRMEFEEAREGLAPTPHARFAEIADLVRAATDILTESTGTLAHAQAAALLTSARTLNSPFLQSDVEKEAQVATEILAQLTLLGTELTASALDLSMFYGAAARVEISAGKIRP